MSAPQRRELTDSPSPERPDPSPTLASLRQAGADRFDPVQFHYLQTLEQRASAGQDAVARRLDARWVQALAALAQRFEQAQSAPRATPPSDGLCATDTRDSLAALTRDLAQRRPQPAAAHAPWPGAARPELKSVQYFRDTWSKLSADKQLTQALEMLPVNAGPINSQRVLLRSLELMRDISPDYLNRFMSYANTLLCLDAGQPVPTPAAKAVAPSASRRGRGAAS